LTASAGFRIYVSSAARGGGGGRALIGAVAAAAKEAGGKPLLEHPRDRRRRAASLSAPDSSSIGSMICEFADRIQKSEVGRLAPPRNFPHLTGGTRGEIVAGRRGGEKIMVTRRLTKRSLALAKANVQTGMDAAMTIAARTQNLMSPAGRPADKAREARLMIQEKLDAAVEGAIAAQAAWGTFLVKAAFGGVRTPDDLSAGLAGVAEAAAKPARRRVRANARRLSGTKSVF
jgi:hypothetical protein